MHTYEMVHRGCQHAQALGVECDAQVFGIGKFISRTIHMAFLYLMRADPIMMHPIKTSPFLVPISCDYGAYLCSTPRRCAVTEAWHSSCGLHTHNPGTGAGSQAAARRREEGDGEAEGRQGAMQVLQALHLYLLIFFFGGGVVLVGML